VKSIFEEYGDDALSDYLNECSKHVDLDISKSYRLAKTALKYYQGNKSLKEEMRVFQELETLWYESLAEGTPDYSTYNDVAFLSDVWSCWIIYSRKYLLSLKSDKSLFGKSIVSDIGKIDSFVDVGCGFGYTTSGLKELFPEAKGYATNIEGSCQFKIAAEIGKVRNFKVFPSVKDIKSEVNLVFASEYFEHFEKPVEHLLEIIDHCNPSFIITANAFNSISHGHFLTFIHGNKKYDGLQISKLFNDTLRSKGFEKVNTACWNNRPSYWRKCINKKGLFF
jgi:SAM-dependent methyltransferase